MNNIELESIAKNLIETTQLAGRKSIEIREKGLKTIIKPLFCCNKKDLQVDLSNGSPLLFFLFL